MKIGGLAAAAKLACLVLLAQSISAQATEVNLFAAAGFRAVMNEIAPAFERATGHKVVVIFDAVGPLRRRINAGESFDAIVAPDAVNDLIKQGKIATDTRTDIARAGLGVAVREGAKKPDITSVDAFKRALLDAKSVSYTGEGFSGEYFVGLLDRLKIAEPMKPKLRPMAAADVVKAAATGEADLAVFVIPGILAVRGVELAGPLPAELQTYAELTAGISTAAKEPEAGKALLKFLRSDTATAVIKAKGWEPARHK